MECRSRGDETPFEFSIYDLRLTIPEVRASSRRLLQQKTEEPLRGAAPVMKNKNLTSDRADYARLRRRANSMPRPPKPANASVPGSGIGSAPVNIGTPAGKA